MNIKPAYNINDYNIKNYNYPYYFELESWKNEYYFVGKWLPKIAFWTFIFSGVALLGIPMVLAALTVSLVGTTVVIWLGISAGLLILGGLFQLVSSTYYSRADKTAQEQWKTESASKYCTTQENDEREAVYVNLQYNVYTGNLSTPTATKKFWVSYPATTEDVDIKEEESKNNNNNDNEANKLQEKAKEILVAFIKRLQDSLKGKDSKTIVKDIKITFYDTFNDLRENRSDKKGVQFDGQIAFKQDTKQFQPTITSKDLEIIKFDPIDPDYVEQQLQQNKPTENQNTTNSGNQH